jgi:hypothetical protein
MTRASCIWSIMLCRFWAWKRTRMVQSQEQGQRGSKRKRLGRKESKHVSQLDWEEIGLNVRCERTKEKQLSRREIIFVAVFRPKAAKLEENVKLRAQKVLDTWSIRNGGDRNAQQQGLTPHGYHAQRLPLAVGLNSSVSSLRLPNRCAHSNNGIKGMVSWNLSVCLTNLEWVWVWSQEVPEMHRQGMHEKCC